MLQRRTRKEFWRAPHFIAGVMAHSKPNLLGYGANNFFSGPVPIFWGGNVKTRQGFTADYQRNVFHTRKWFAFDVGTTTLVSHAVGRKEQDTARLVFNQSLGLAATLGLLFLAAL